MLWCSSVKDVVCMLCAYVSKISSHHDLLKHDNLSFPVLGPHRKITRAARPDNDRLQGRRGVASGLWFPLEPDWTRLTRPRQGLNSKFRSQS